MAQLQEMSLKHHYFARIAKKVMPITNHASNNYEVINMH